MRRTAKLLLLALVSGTASLPASATPLCSWLPDWLESPCVTLGDLWRPLAFGLDPTGADVPGEIHANLPIGPSSSLGEGETHWPGEGAGIDPYGDRLLR